MFYTLKYFDPFFLHKKSFLSIRKGDLYDLIKGFWKKLVFFVFQLFLLWVSSELGKLDDIKFVSYQSLRK